MFYLTIGLTVLVAYFALAPLKAAAEYRFRGKTGLAIEGFGLLACAAVGLLTWNPWLLMGGALVGVGIRQLPNNHRRYIE